MDHCCHHEDGRHHHYAAKAWYKNKLILINAGIVLLLVLSFFIGGLEPFRREFVFYLRAVWWAVLIGLVLGGVIDYYIPQQYISQVLARKKKRTIVYAVGLGFLGSACSHGILALAIQLYKKGASVPAVIAFLLASPWANLPLTFMLIGFFGVQQALFIIIVAIIIALTTGFIYQLLDHYKMIDHNQNSTPYDAQFSVASDLKKRLSGYKFSTARLKKDFLGVAKGGIELSNMVLWWILIGIGLASLIGAYVPEHIFHKYMGPSALGLTVTLIAATIMEVCSEGTAPLAFEIFRQTGALGNSFVFLMAGVATDYTEIGLLWTNIGKRTALLLPLVTVPQILFWGILANRIF